MFFTNARIFGMDGRFHRGGFQVVEGKFARVMTGDAPPDAPDLQGALVIPGLVDIHIHGCSGADVSDATAASLEAMSRFLVHRGVTSFLPTTMTLPFDRLAQCAQNVRSAMDSAPGARVLGMRMEGPFVSRAKCGAQNPDYIALPDWEALGPLLETGAVKFLDIAPELPGAEELISRAGGQCRVSLGHTDCTYDRAVAGFEAGASHVTHLFNAMPPLHHRHPGLLPAAAEREKVTAELICDGFHVHPATVRLAWRMFGAKRMLLVSDAGRCCGLPEGTEFDLGGQQAVLSQGAGRLPEGTLACSASTLMDCLRNAVAFGISLEEAVYSATLAPAMAVGREDLGRIADGAQADFLVCDQNLNIRSIFLGGKEVL